MELLTKKTLCPICDEEISWLLPSKIEEEYVCSTCYNKIDMDADMAYHLSMHGFREYLMFYDHNQLLKSTFEKTHEIDFGFGDSKIVFDLPKKLFYTSEDQSKTVFEGNQLISFLIKEDEALLFEGSEKGIKRYVSSVPKRAMAMEAQIAQAFGNKQMTRTMKEFKSGEINGFISHQTFDGTEPFQEFKVELHFDHPYWSVIKYNMKAPTLANDNPDVNNYLNSYQQGVEIMEKLAETLWVVAFSNVVEESVKPDAAICMNKSIISDADVYELINNCNRLLADGIIYQQKKDLK